MDTFSQMIDYHPYSSVPTNQRLSQQKLIGTTTNTAMPASRQTFPAFQFPKTDGQHPLYIIINNEKFKHFLAHLLLIIAFKQKTRSQPSLSEQASTLSRSRPRTYLARRTTSSRVQ